MDRKIIKQKTVVAQVMDEIKQFIASGRYKAGDKIPPENELAELFGVSRPTIREAIKIFNYLGVLDSQTGKGTYVSEGEKISTEALTWSILLGNSELSELIEVRLIIEERSLIKVTTAYQRNRENVQDIISDLEGHVATMKSMVTNFSHERLTQADYNFHATIISGSRNTKFSSIYHTLKSFMHEEISRTHQVIDHVDQIIEQHERILNAIKTGEPKQALAAFKAHMTSTCWQIFNGMPEILEI